VRILYVAPMLWPDSSWGRWLIELLRHVRPQGVVPVLLVTPGQAKYLDAIPELTGVEVHAVYPDRYLRYFTSRRGPVALAEMPGWLRGLPDLGCVDLVHSVEAHPWSWYARQLARRLGCPFLFTIHGDYGWIAHRRPLDKWMYAATVSDAAAICPVSHAGAALLSRWFPQTELERVQVIHNTVEVGSFAPIVEARAREYGRSDGIRVLTVARLIPVKGLETSIAAFVQMRESGVKGTYRVVGAGVGGGYHRSLLSVIPDRYRADVSFVGPLSFDGVKSEYANADACLLTSRAIGERVEGLPLVILEAAASGIPVLVTRNGGIPEGVADGSSGLLFDEGDVAAIAQGLRNLATDREYADRLRQGAVSWASGFDNSVRAAAYLDVYRASAREGCPQRAVSHVEPRRRDS
jgi:glycosyltransferase involved in cell wall biosynthesis